MWKDKHPCLDNHISRPLLPYQQYNNAFSVVPHSRDWAPVCSPLPHVPWSHIWKDSHLYLELKTTTTVESKPENYRLNLKKPNDIHIKLYINTWITQNPVSLFLPSSPHFLLLLAPSLHNEERCKVSEGRFDFKYHLEINTVLWI